MKLKCNLCEKYVTNQHVFPTDELWIRNIRGRDYLVCKYHRGRIHEKPVFDRHTSGIPGETSTSD